MCKSKPMWTNCVPSCKMHRISPWMMDVGFVPVACCCYAGWASVYSMLMSLYSQAWVYFLWIDRDTSSWTFIAPLSDVYLRVDPGHWALLASACFSSSVFVFLLLCFFISFLFTRLHMNRMKMTGKKWGWLWKYGYRSKETKSCLCNGWQFVLKWTSLNHVVN